MSIVNELFAAVFVSSPLGIAVLDDDAWLSRSNPALQRMLGRSEIELTTTMFADLMHSPDIAADAVRVDVAMTSLNGNFVASMGARYGGESSCRAIEVQRIRTGLGLAVVADIARRWQGHVHVDSHVGQGVTFRVLLPHMQAN